MINEMKVSSKAAEDNKVEIEITVSKEDVDKFIADAYKQVNGKYRIPGFRAGKAPRKVLDNAIGRDSILAQATDDLMNASYPMALDDEGLFVLGEPEIATEALVVEGNDFAYTAKLVTKPVLELTEYGPVEIEMPPDEVTDDEMESQIEMLKSYYYSFEDIEGRPVKDGDFVLCDFTSKKDGVDVPDLSGTGRIFEIGGGIFPHEFDENIIGMNVGDQKTFDFDYEGEKVTCDLTLKGIREKKLPEFDDEFAKQSGFTTADDFREAIRSTLASQKQQSLPRLKEDRCMDQLQSRLQGDVPEALVDVEFNNLAQQMLRNLQQSGMTLDQYLSQQGITSDQFREDLRAQAADVAAQELALDALAKNLGIEVADDDIDQAMIEAGIEDAPAARVQWHEAGRLSELRESIRRQKASDWLLENAKVTHPEEKPAKKAPAKKAAAKKADEAAEPAPKKAPAKKAAAKKNESADKPAAEKKPAAKKAPAKKAAAKKETEE